MDSIDRVAYASITDPRLMATSGKNQHNDALHMIRTSLWSFGLTLALNTLLLALFTIFNDAVLLAIFGLFLLFVAFLFNCIVVVNNLIFICFNRERRWQLLLCTLLLFVNVPIIRFYVNCM